ncbi:putative myosin-binding protein 5 [Hibiscus syriacus]|uniref:Myosin-binding protein 5 n=1 Tax=Hibiscus syriacus TaxID=106335 RepID=A0A6A3A6B7_HIBSY|nr:probable myosin-binding protein 5 [Hibiscus syriacus]KAE8699900.1 putative myosin-binding protein 5 [Hibiscus syriacus]
MGKRSFKQFIEEELGSVPKFFIYALLEWAMIFMLFVGGFVAFVTNEFAKFFELPVPCLFCTRLDHLLLGKTSHVHYNESVCDEHKKSVSCLAFCHAHKKLSDIRNLCESCLLSFATERDTDCDRYKSLLGILHKDVDQLLFDENGEVQFSIPFGVKRVEEPADFEKSNEHRCTCCGQPLKLKFTGSKDKFSSLSSMALSPSPRALSDNMLQIKYSELKVKLDEPEALEDNDRSKVKEDGKGGPMPMVPEGDEDDKTPNVIKSNKFFGISLSDSCNDSPRWNRTPRKLLLQKPEFASECGGEGQAPNSPRMDRKSLMALYMELDEERSASAEAAYNAMAMITRLQAEKAAVQMEALQYQRMMEEQAEYDQEALEEMVNLVAKREEELNELEAELEVYRAKYGGLKETDFEKHAPRDENDEGNNNDNNHNGKPETAFTTTTAENSETQQGQAESNPSNQEKVGAAETHKIMGSESNSSAEATAKSKKAMRQMDRLKILQKKMHISTMGRHERPNCEFEDEFEEDQ